MESKTLVIRDGYEVWTYTLSEDKDGVIEVDLSEYNIKRVVGLWLHEVMDHENCFDIEEFMEDNGIICRWRDDEPDPDEIDIDVYIESGIYNHRDGQIYYGDEPLDVYTRPIECTEWNICHINFINEGEEVLSINAYVDEIKSLFTEYNKKYDNDEYLRTFNDYLSDNGIAWEQSEPKYDLVLDERKVRAEYQS